MKHRVGDQGGGSDAVAGASAAVETVIVVFKTHLDLGFTDLAATVERRYIEDFFPAVLALAREHTFCWTTGSYIFTRWIESLAGTALREAEAAIAAGHVTWHALPFTFHSELLSAGLLEAGLALSRRLDQRFGHRTQAAKMTDVPGHTRGIIPPLARAGVRFLHIGINPFSRPIDVPRLFRWRAPGGEEVIVQYDAEDYGITVAAPGQRVALCFCHTGDNAGPPSAKQIEDAFVQARTAFPHADIRTGSLDDYAERIDPQGLPVVTGEMGDSWIHGVGSAPVKVAAYRELLRRREREPPDLERDRRLLCVAEHTWGMSRARLNDYTHYTPAMLRRFRETETCQTVEASWREQEAYVDATSQATRPVPRGLPAALDLARGATRLRIDRATGAAISLCHDGTEYLGDGRMLGLFQYAVFSQRTCEAYVRHYGRLNPRTEAWGPISFARPGFDPEDGIQDAVWLPAAQTIEHDGTRLTVWCRMPEHPVTTFAAPREVVLAWRLPAEGVVELELQTFDRQASRLPDAMWCSFAPRATGLQLDKLGDWIAPRDVLSGGSRHLHAVGSGVRWHGGLLLETLDAPLIAVGTPTLCPTHDAPPDLDADIHVNLWNNWWNTNFPYWSEDDLRFRFRLTMGDCGICR